MKTAILLTSAFCISILACNQNKTQQKTSGDVMSQPEQCYRSLASKDSATLSLKELDGKVTGSLNLMFAKKDHMKGEISGKFSGDTLFADFTYKMGNGKETFKNPAAFLKKDGKLYQGYGQILTQYGRTFFDKKQPITFDRGFVFEPVDCKQGI